MYFTDLSVCEMRLIGQLNERLKIDSQSIKSSILEDSCCCIVGHVIVATSGRLFMLISVAEHCLSFFFIKLRVLCQLYSLNNYNIYIACDR